MAHKRNATALGSSTEEGYFYSASFQVARVIVNGVPRCGSNGFLIISKSRQSHMECGIDLDKALKPDLWNGSLAGAEKSGS
jgi:hypothetical protein